MNAPVLICDNILGVLLVYEIRCSKKSASQENAHNVLLTDTGREREGANVEIYLIFLTETRMRLSLALARQRITRLLAPSLCSDMLLTSCRQFFSFNELTWPSQRQRGHTKFNCAYKHVYVSNCIFYL